jgi:hypothetical protein
MADARKGDLVQIHKIILNPDQRPDSLPDSTKSVPYECWIKGFLLNNEARIGQEVQTETFIGREISGTLVSVNPVYDHSFGLPQKELLSIGRELKKI